MGWASPSSWMFVAAFVLAGCAGPTPDAAPQDPAGAPQLEATATTGVLRGIVVDEAIRPVAGVTVVVQGAATRNATTDDAGFFGIAGLPPGTYQVAASKVAYVAVQTVADVAAGVSDPPLVRLQMTFIPSEAPYVTEFLHNGFAQCIVPGANVCGIANLYPCVIAQTLGQPCFGNLTSDASLLRVVEPFTDAQRRPAWTQLEIIWGSTQPVTDWLSFRVSPYQWENGAGIDERALNVAGKSPVLFTRNATEAEEWDLGLASGEGDPQGMAVETFAAGNDLTCAGPPREFINSCSSIGVVVNQKMDFFFHLFYGYLPPDGWRLSADGTTPPP